uniref:DNA-directed RNA polymerase subunit alpha n=1 Tax=Pilgerodendron uviferum TaxID=103979 RepID=A0A6J4AHX9_9CONI|nr:RNA polymerase alpha subunit [Pilgerodendron uviferum]BBN66853.1 RNA polymerase alpha chain [Pilgerodendron uviferum]
MNDNKKSVSIKIPELKCVESRTDSKRFHYDRFTLSPLRNGQANTIGSAIRRVLLGEVEGTCVTHVIFNKISLANEYSVLTGITESIHDILMNLKKIVLRSDAYGIRKGSIRVDGPKKVTAQDIMLPPSVRIIDPTQHIATINNYMTLDISLVIEKGRGYLIHALKKDEIFLKDNDFIFYIDAAFAPVQNVNYSIHSYWSEENEIQEILFLEIWTNGGVTPKEALYEASRNFIDFFLPFLNAKEENSNRTNSLNDNITPSLLISDISTDTKRIHFDEMYIDQLDFSTRIYNCLKKENINTVSDLLNYSREDFLKIKHLGEQSVKEILEFMEHIRKI